jgi:hypothetical protein
MAKGAMGNLQVVYQGEFKKLEWEIRETSDKNHGVNLFR